MEAIEMTVNIQKLKEKKKKTLMAQSWVPPPPRTVSVLSTGDRLPC